MDIGYNSYIFIYIYIYVHTYTYLYRNKCLYVHTHLHRRHAQVAGHVYVAPNCPGPRPQAGPVLSPHDLEGALVWPIG